MLLSKTTGELCSFLCCWVSREGRWGGDQDTRGRRWWSIGGLELLKKRTCGNTFSVGLLTWFCWLVWSWTLMDSFSPSGHSPSGLVLTRFSFSHLNWLYRCILCLSWAFWPTMLFSFFFFYSILTWHYMDGKINIMVFCLHLIPLPVCFIHVRKASHFGCLSHTCWQCLSDLVH